MSPVALMVVYTGDTFFGLAYNGALNFELFDFFTNKYTRSDAAMMVQGDLAEKFHRV